jgi:hypothetical protein
MLPDTGRKRILEVCCPIMRVRFLDNRIAVKKEQ